MLIIFSFNVNGIFMVFSWIALPEDLTRMENALDKKCKRYGNIKFEQFVSFIEIMLSLLSFSTEFTLSMRNISFFTFVSTFILYKFHTIDVCDFVIILPYRNILCQLIIRIMNSLRAHYRAFPVQ